jgi:hypothetical protein
MIPVRITPGMGSRGDKEEWWKGWIQPWYIWYIARTFANATMYPHTRQKEKRRKKNLRKNTYNLNTLIKSRNWINNLKIIIKKIRDRSPHKLILSSI